MFYCNHTDLWTHALAALWIAVHRIMRTRLRLAAVASTTSVMYNVQDRSALLARGFADETLGRVSVAVGRTHGMRAVRINRCRVSIGDHR